MLLNNGRTNRISHKIKIKLFPFSWVIKLWVTNWQKFNPTYTEDSTSNSTYHTFLIQYNPDFTFSLFERKPCVFLHIITLIVFYKPNLKYSRPYLSTRAIRCYCYQCRSLRLYLGLQMTYQMS